MTDAATTKTLTGVELRCLLCTLVLDNPGDSSIEALVAAVEEHGFILVGRPSKTISDALRWEVRKGRIVRTARGCYAAGSVPRSTRWWLRQRATRTRP